MLSRIREDKLLASVPGGRLEMHTIMLAYYCLYYLLNKYAFALYLVSYVCTLESFDMQLVSEM